MSKANTKETLQAIAADAGDTLDAPDSIDMAVQAYLSLDSGDQGTFMAQLGETFGEALAPWTVQRSVKRHKDDVNPVPVEWTFNFTDVSLDSIVSLAVGQLVVQAQNSTRVAVNGKEATKNREAVKPISIDGYRERTWDVAKMLPKARTPKAPPTAEQTMEGIASLNAAQLREAMAKMQAMMDAK